MLLYLDHALHGTHICYDAEELKRLQVAGWNLRDPQPRDAVVPPGMALKPSPDPLAIAANFDRTNEAPRRGRKPKGVQA